MMSKTGLAIFLALAFGLCMGRKPIRQLSFSQGAFGEGEERGVSLGELRSQVKAIEDQKRSTDDISGPFVSVDERVIARNSIRHRRRECRDSRRWIFISEPLASASERGLKQAHVADSIGPAVLGEL